MAYTGEFDEKKNEISNIFANVIRIAGSISTVAVDTIDKYAKPRQAKTEILKMMKEIEGKLEGIK